MEVLPYGAADRARNAYVVLQPREPALDSLRDELGHDGAALDPEPPVVQKFQVAGRIPDNKSAEAFVADEDVGAEPEHEIVDAEVSGSSYGPCQIVGRCCIVKEIGWTTDPECGVLSERLTAFEPLRVHTLR